MPYIKIFLQEKNDESLKCLGLALLLFGKNCRYEFINSVDVDGRIIRFIEKNEYNDYDNVYIFLNVDEHTKKVIKNINDEYRQEYNQEKFCNLIHGLKWDEFYICMANTIEKFIKNTNIVIPNFYDKYKDS